MQPKVDEQGHGHRLLHRRHVWCPFVWVSQRPVRRSRDEHAVPSSGHMCAQPIISQEASGGPLCGRCRWCHSLLLPPNPLTHELLFCSSCWLPGWGSRVPDSSFFVSRHGRRPLLLASYLGSILFAVLSAFSTSYLMFVIVRFLAGMVLAGTAIISFVLSESADSKVTLNAALNIWMLLQMLSGSAWSTGPSLGSSCAWM